MFIVLKSNSLKSLIIAEPFPMVVLAVVVLLAAGRASGERHFSQRFYKHMFAQQDADWQDRECLLTVQGREYVGVLRTPRRGHEYLRCLPWEKVAERVARYDPSSNISNENFPGFKSSQNQDYCRNPGGIWSQPGCFLQYPRDKDEERSKAASCGVPMCPVLTQFRSCPAGREYGGQLDLRNMSQCVDKCEFRHTLLGPACTLVLPEERSSRGSRQVPRVTPTRKWEVYYPCDVPLLDGETVTLKAGTVGAPEGWDTFTPVTWYLTPGKFIDLTQGAEGRMLLQLPQDLFYDGREMSLRFYVRLGDSMDVNDFEFEMFLSPDPSLVEVVTVTVDIKGIHVVYKKSAAYQLPKDRDLLVHASRPVPWATLMYRWLQLLVTVRSRSVKVSVFGAGNDPEDVFKSGFVELLSGDHTIQMPRYVHMASLGGTTLAAIDSLNGCGFACTEGIVKLPKADTKYYQWAVLPKTIPPVPNAPTTTRVPHFQHSPFSDRKLRIQIFNTPFSLWLSSAPILPSEVARGKGISGRKLNVVQILVGRAKVTVIRCGSLESVDSLSDTVTCSPGSEEVFTAGLRRTVRRGQEVVVDVAASERPGGWSSLVVRVELHVQGREEHTFTISHPVFPRYWALVKSKNPAIFSKSDQRDNKFLFFRILNGRCKRTRSYLQAQGCMTTNITTPSKPLEEDFWRKQRSLKDVEETSELATQAIKDREGYVSGPMFQQTLDRSCLSWATFGTSKDDSESLQKIGNQCLYRNETGTPFCLVDLWGTRQQCELDHCSQNTMRCFDRAHVVRHQSHRRGNCLDSTEVLLVNLGAVPSPANPTHYVFNRKYDFEVKVWEPSTKNLHLCVYLYSWKKLEVIFRIGPKHLIQNRPGTYDLKMVSADTFLVPWRYTPYSVLDADGKWTLYLEEYALPLLTHYSARLLTRVGFDACTADMRRVNDTEQQLNVSHVLVKLSQQPKTPTLTHYFETSYFPEVPFNVTDVAKQWGRLYSMIAGHNTFLRIVDNQVSLWVKAKSKDLEGGIVIFLMEKFTRGKEERAMIHFDRRSISLVGPGKSNYVKKITNIKKSLFPLYLVEVDIRITIKHSGTTVRVRLSTPSSSRQAEASLTFRRLMLNYAALTSYKTTLVQWSLGDKVPPEDPRKKPINGGWSKWVLKNCSKPCGGGEGFMERHCTNPTPSLMGRPCLGPGLKPLPCNTRRCNRLSKDLEEYIRRSITKRPASRRVPVFASVKMSCPRDLIDRVALEFPEVKFFWQHHTGRFFPNASSFTSSMKQKLTKAKLGWLVRHVYVKDNVMVIDAAVKELSGLWLFVAETEENLLTVVHVAPLVVEDAGEAGSQVSVEAEEVLLACNAGGLSRLTRGNIQQTWLLEGVAYRSVAHVDSTRNDIMLIPEVRLNHSGVWKCVNTHMKTKVTYSTAFVKLRVLPKSAKFDPTSFRGPLTSVLLVCGISFLICLYNIVVAFLTIALSKRNFVLSRHVKVMKKKFTGMQRAAMMGVKNKIAL